MAKTRYPATQTQARTFGESVLTTLRSSPFGALPKAELELALFRGLIESGVIDPAEPLFDLARKLEITPARVRGLVYRYRLLTEDSDADVFDQIVAALGRTRFELSADTIVFGIEDPYLRDSLAAALKQRGVFADTSFNPETVRLSLDAFVEFVTSRLNPSDREQILRALTQDTHVELGKFKRILKSTLAAVGKRFVGAAADEAAANLVDAAWQFTTDLIRGDATGAAAAASRLS
jgi:hypothetical protein